MEAEPLVLGTAGHVDHGKTSLVLALTGRDTDRLAAEKARGISIELGFAPLRLPSGRTVSLVDVPGHERFVRHMVAGTSGVDAFLLCVAADDGVMPQTREHAAVLELLGVADGVVAITRSDLADPGPAAAQVRALLGPGPEVVPVCAPRGDGLPELRAALDRLAARVASRRAQGPARLFVDRAFSVAGAGTVVTGTLWGAAVATGDRVAVHPSGAEARVRGVQVHDAPVERATGGRVALALAGLPRDAAPRGSCVVQAGDAWTPTDRLGVRLRWLEDAGGDLTEGRRLQLFLGTAEVPATCVPLAPARVTPGGTAWTALRLERPVLARPGDRLVLRSAERRTVGGAEVVDAHPPRRARRADRVARLEVLAGGTPEERAALALADAGARGVDAAELDPPPAGAAVLGGRAFGDAVVARARAAALRTVGDDGAPLARARAATGLPAAAAAALVDALVGEGAAAVRGQRLVPPGSGALDAGAERVARLLEEGGLRPPTPHQLGEAAGLDAAALRAALGRLRAAGRAAPAGELWFDAGALAAATEQARAALAERPLRVSELRDLWGVGRRNALALVAHLDATGVTVRRGDERILRGAGRAAG